MSARHGLVFYSCGHQDPIPTGPDRHVAGSCRACAAYRRDQSGGSDVAHPAPVFVCDLEERL
jgi:hypothetical protein